MANIKINDLQPAEFELLTLSDLELQGIVGGGFWKRFCDEIKRIGRQINDAFDSSGGSTSVQTTTTITDTSGYGYDSPFYGGSSGCGGL